MFDNSENNSTERPVAAILLAAGKGKRMGSDLPKVVLEVAGKPMIWWVVQAVRDLGAELIILVIGHGGEKVREVFSGDDHDIKYVTQEEQKGTGHATNCARELLKDFAGDVFVLGGDGPLIRACILQQMLNRQRCSQAVATLATASIDDPTGYGRIIRNDQGKFDSIVEHSNATPDQQLINEIYPSYACFDAQMLFETLKQLEPNATTGEYYVTDVPTMLGAKGKTIELVEGVPAEDILSINTPQQLAQVEAILNSRSLEEV